METQGEEFSHLAGQQPHIHWKQKQKSNGEEKFAHNVASTNLFPIITSLLCIKK